MKYPSRKNIRLKSWDYSTHACYHVTVCTAGNKPLLSTVNPNSYEVNLTAIGTIVDNAIRESCKRYPMAIVENYVIMPNHVHLLIAISKSSTTLGRFMGFMKSHATRHVRKTHPGMQLWQRSFYDHIIFDDENFFNSWQYIEDNPARWATDNYYVG